jgi:hypothetical protein
MDFATPPVFLHVTSSQRLLVALAAYPAPSRHYPERDLAIATTTIESVSFTSPPATR